MGDHPEPDQRHGVGVLREPGLHLRHPGDHQGQQQQRRVGGHHGQRLPARRQRPLDAVRHQRLDRRTHPRNRHWLGHGREPGRAVHTRMHRYGQHRRPRGLLLCRRRRWQAVEIRPDQHHAGQLDGNPAAHHLTGPGHYHGAGRGHAPERRDHGQLRHRQDVHRGRQDRRHDRLFRVRHLGWRRRQRSDPDADADRACLCHGRRNHPGTGLDSEPADVATCSRRRPQGLAGRAAGGRARAGRYGLHRKRALLLQQLQPDHQQLRAAPGHAQRRQLADGTRLPERRHHHQQPVPRPQRRPAGDRPRPRQVHLRGHHPHRQGDWRRQPHYRRHSCRQARRQWRGLAPDPGAARLAQ